VLVLGALWLAEERVPTAPLRLEPLGEAENTPPAESPHAPLPLSRTEASEPRPEPAPSARPRVEDTAREDPSWLVRGAVIDPSGAGLADVELVLRPGPGRELRTRTTAGGDFQLRTPHLGTAVEPASGSLAVVARAGDVEGRRQTLVVGPTRELAGRVEDETGRPLARVSVQASPSPSALAELPGSLRGFELESRSLSTDAHGEFLLPRLPADVEGRLTFTANGFEPLELSWPENGAPLRVRLTARAEALRVRGIVRNTSGEPVSDAQVTGPGLRERTAADGGFHSSARVPAGSELTAYHPALGLATAIVPAASATADREPPLELVLQPARYRVTGRLLDEEHAPLEGWIVSVLEPREQSWVDSRTGPRRAVEVDETDAAGAFLVAGNFPSDTIRLCAWSKVLGRCEVSRPLTLDGTDLDWVLPAPRWRPPASLEVLDSGGAPIARATVTVHPTRSLSGSGDAFVETEAAWTGPVTHRTTTDSAGLALLSRVPHDPVELEVRARDCVPKRLRLGGADALPERLTLLRTGEILVRLGDLGEGSHSLVLLDSDGTPCPVARAMSRFGDERSVETEGAASVRLTVGEGARTLAVFEGSDLRVSRPVRVEPGGLTTVDL